MIGKWRRLLTLGVGLISTVGFVNVVAGPSEHAWLSGASGTGGGPTAESILGSGSDTTIILMENIDGLYIASEGCLKFSATTKPLDFSCVVPDPAGTLFTENYEHDQAHEADFIGSGTGIKQLCHQGQTGVTYIDFARSSRAPATGDCTGLHFVAYARDGISLEAFDDGTADSGIHAMANTDPLCVGLGFCLTQAQVKGIYASCTIKNWNDSTLGGQALPIQLYTPQSGSGTRAQFETFLGISDSTVCIAADGQNVTTHSASVPENQNTGILPADKNTAIFPFSFAIFSTEVGVNTTTPNYFLSKIDGIAVTSVTIADSSFPYGRNVYNVYCSTSASGTCGDQSTFPNNHMATQKTVDYVAEEGWICKPGVNIVPGWVGNQNVPALDNNPTGQNAAGPHHVSPHYNANWHNIIAQKITRQGFGPFALGLIGGGDTNSDYCRLTTT